MKIQQILLSILANNAKVTPTNKQCVSKHRVGISLACWVGLVMGLTTISAQGAITIAPPFNTSYTVHPLGSITGLPTSYGGLIFKLGDNNTILIGGNANSTAGRFFEVPVTRGTGGHITSFGTPVSTGFGGNNDGGVSYGPSDVLFYSKYRLTKIGQVKVGSNTENKTNDLASIGVAASPGAIGFVPAGYNGGGKLKVCSYSGGQFYDVTYAPDGNGTYNLTSAVQKAVVPGGPEGFIYAPLNSPQLNDGTLLITQFDANKVSAFDTDRNGDPIINTGKNFVLGLDGGEGATIDPVTGDFLFSTFGSNNRVIQIQGFTPPPPPANIDLVSSSNPSFQGFSVTLTATVTGVSPTGTVTFKEGASDIANCVDVALAGGTAACTTASLPTGTHIITALYSGDGNNSGSSTDINQVVDNNPLLATLDTYSVSEDGVLTVSSPGVLENDHDASNNPFTAALNSNVSNGTLSLAADGSFIYTPTALFSGSDTFSYHANNGINDSNIVTVTITVNHINHAPVAQDDAITTAEDTPLTLLVANGVLNNDHDVDVHDSLQAIKVTDPTNGSIAFNADGSLVYTPTTNYNGPDSFTYKANDGHTDSNIATVQITVTAVNDAPLAQADSYTAQEGTQLNTSATLGVLHNDTDPEGNSITAVIITNPGHGLLLLNPDGSFKYTPDANFNGNDSFTYKTNDGQLDSAVVMVSIHVSAVNDPPVAMSDAYLAHEDTGLSVPAATGLLNNDIDPEHNQLTVKLVANVSHGTLHLNTDGSFDYTPALNYNGTDSFRYQANDGHLDSNAVTVLLSIDAVNDAPLAVNDSYTISEDTLLNVNAALGLLSNDSDPDGDLLIAQLDLSPTHGTVHFNLDGSFSYQPDANFGGTDFFSYHVNDGNLDSALAVVNLTVRSVNDAPLGANDSYSTQEDTAINVSAVNGVLANDTDIDGDILHALISSAPANGQVNLSLDGSFIYTPNQNFNGIDSFTYKVTDGVVASADVTVSINVDSVNDAPIAASDSYSIGEDGFLRVTLASGLLVNDYDADANILHVNLITGVNNGTLQLSLDGSFTYKPAIGFSGTDSFTYKANDGQTDGNLVTVTITVNHINHPPLPNSDAYTIAQDTVLSVTVANGLLANDLDIDGDTLLVTDIPTSVSHGALQIQLDGSFNYTPSPGYFGPDNFTYTVNDGSVDSAPVTVNLTVNNINHAPLAANDVYSLSQDSVLTIPANSGLLANDLDADGDSLFVLIQSFPANGALHQDLDGGFTYLPATGFQGSDSYTYLATDGQLNSQIVTVTLTVNQINHAPLAGADSYSTTRDTVLQISSAMGVLSNDMDQDADVLSALIVTQPQNGTVQLNNNGSFKYTPAASYAGLDSFSYKARDSSLDSNIATVVIDVHFTNRPPVVAQPANYSVPQNAPLQVSAPGVLTNATDADGDQLTALLISGPATGSLHLNLDGSFIYTPLLGTAGTQVSFIFVVSDGSSTSTNTIVQINITQGALIPIPTLSQWTAILLILLILLVAGRMQYFRK